METAGQIASPRRRFAGWVADAFVASLIFAIPLTLAIGPDPAADVVAAAAIGVTVFVFIYMIAFDGSKSGATPGKRIVGTRVVDASTGSGPIGYRRATLRRLGYVLGYVCLLVGWLWLIWDPRQQAWHDKLANTLVIRTR